jgi:hypothetical protein
VLLAIPSAGTTPPEAAGAAGAAGVGAAGELGAVSVLAALVTADDEVSTPGVLTPEPLVFLTRSPGESPEVVRCLPERREPLRRALDTDPATDESAPAAPDAAGELVVLVVVLGELCPDEGPPPEDRPSRKGPLPARRPRCEGRPAGSCWPPADPLAGESWGSGEGAPLPGCGAEPPRGESLPCDGLPVGELLRTEGGPDGEALPGW